MQDLTPLRPAFWNVPLWAEIGVYVIGIAAVVLCIAGIVRAVKQRQASCPPEALPDRNARLGRTLLEVFWQKRIRDTAAGKNHFVLFWGFIFLFFGTAIATIDWDIAWLIFGKRILSGNIYLAYKFVLDLAGLLALIALGGLGIKEALAQAKLFNFTSNFASLLVFALGGQVLWLLGFIMGIGQFIGANIGSRVALRYGIKIIKPLVVTVSLIVCVKLLYNEYII